MALTLGGIEISLDLAIICSIIVALITWKMTKDKELNEQKKKEKAEMQRLGFEYVTKLRESVKKLVDFRIFHNSLEDKNQQKELHSHLIAEYQKNLNDFLFNCGTYGLKDFIHQLKRV